MPTYRIEEISFIDNKLVQAGDEIETDAPPAPHWTPLDKPAEKAAKIAEQEEAARISALKAQQAKIEEAEQVLVVAGLN